MYRIETYTYIIRMKNTDNYKIGQSRKPIKRVQQLQTACPESLELIAYVKSDIWLEKRLHRMFYMSRKRGEWFTLSYTKLNMILSYLKERFDDSLTINCMITNCSSSPCPYSKSLDLCLNN